MHRLIPVLLVFLVWSGDLWAVVDGTTGPPLGGIGCGAIKFCAHNGTFAFSKSAPIQKENFSALSGAQFQFFSNRGGTIATSQKLTATQTAGRAGDDAIWPLQTANFGTVNNVAITLTGFSPITFSDAKIDTMCFPFAFFEIKVANTQAIAVDVACALQMATPAAPTAVASKGMKTTGGVEIALYAASDDASATVSSGNDNGFFTTGAGNNAPSGTTNRVGVKLTLAANQTRYVRFVYAWYNAPDTGRFYYAKVFANAGSVADLGLAKFTALKTNAVNFVTRMRASNLPSWLIDQTANSLSLFANNSMYLKDERHCYAEGRYKHAGTMDQMWHSRQIVTMTAPYLAWKELEYWGRTQKPSGQIHHDFDGSAPADNNNFICVAWDDVNHPDYAWGSPIEPWVDLNCGLIISTYEAFMATDDHAKLDLLWPYVKKAGQRLIDQVGLYGNRTYPYTFDSSKNSLDAINAARVQGFSTTLSQVSYKILSILAGIKGEAALVTKYSAAFDTVTNSFRARYLTNNFSTGNVCGAYLAGQWMAYYLRLGEFFTKTEIDYAVNQMTTYYNPLVKGMGTWTHYEEWQPYLIAHFGGTLLNTGRVREWDSLQYDMYKRNFLNRNRVYDHPLDIPPRVATPVYLATITAGDTAYMSTPVVWRNYYSIIGYQRNKHTGELWLEPILIPELNHSLTNALYLSPEGMGTISAVESGPSYQDQTITFKPDKPVAVTALYVRDKAGPAVSVTVNGVAQTFTRIGSGYCKELKINWAGTVESSGITIAVSGTSPLARGPGQAAEETRMHTLFIHGRAALKFPARGPIEKLTIATLQGKTVRVLRAGAANTVSWDCPLESGERVPNGIYTVTAHGRFDHYSGQFVVLR